MNLSRLRDFTNARVALGRTGDSLPTRELLEFQLAHARARDAVHANLDAQLLSRELGAAADECILAHSAAPDRATYLRRPDLGRTLTEESRAMLAERRGQFDAVFVIADGLSALAAQVHTPAMIQMLMRALRATDWAIAPIVIVRQGRVAIGDDAACCLGASMSLVLIGERPGLSSPDSLGAYLTWNPRPGTTDADRNCISNIRAQGLSYPAAVHKLLFLMTESRRRKLSGVALKESATAQLER